MNFQLWKFLLKNLISRKCLNNLELIFFNNFNFKIENDKINKILNILLLKDHIVSKYNKLIKIIENNQNGVMSKKYIPGPLSQMEVGLEKLKNWYLNHLELILGS